MGALTQSISRWWMKWTAGDSCEEESEDKMRVRWDCTVHDGTASTSVRTYFIFLEWPRRPGYECLPHNAYTVEANHHTNYLDFLKYLWTVLTSHLQTQPLASNTLDLVLCWAWQAFTNILDKSTGPLWSKCKLRKEARAKVSANRKGSVYNYKRKIICNLGSAFNS